jgi:hypothetical protein
LALLHDRATVHRETFCEYLVQVREIRNAAMHFREPEETDSDILSTFSAMVRDAYLAKLES